MSQQSQTVNVLAWTVQRIKRTGKNCTTCLKFSSKKPNYVSIKQHARHKIPINPWPQLASDIFHFEGDSYLLITDYTSRFPITRKLSLMAGNAIAHHMQAIFAEYRWPNTLVTDNGPCYSGKEFQKLMESMSINHITSSPHYPQSNGLADIFVGIVKNLFYKAKEESLSPYRALMVYRNTPLCGCLQSPMQILQGRQTSTDLPLSHAAMVKVGINHTPTPTAEMLYLKDKSLSAQPHDIPLGQHVMYREPHDGRWYPASITQQLPEKRSYIIKTDENVLYMRTQANLKPYKPKKQMTRPEHNWIHNQTTAELRLKPATKAPNLTCNQYCTIVKAKVIALS